jgi:hypothetical protein
MVALGGGSALGNSSLRRFVAPLRDPLRASGSPDHGEHPEGAQRSSTLISRAFIPPCILKELKDCLSRTSRLKTRPEP